MPRQDTQVNLTATLQHPAQNVHISHLHLITFDERSMDLWQLSPDGRSLNHQVRLSDCIDYLGPEGIFIDEIQEIITIPNNISRPPALWVYSLRSGQLLRKVALYGELAGWPFQYYSGRVLVTVRESDTEAPPDGLTSIILCDVAGDDWLLGDIKLPPDLAERDRAPSHGSLVPVLLTPTGGVIATSSAFFAEKMALLLWQGTDADLPPSRVVEIPLSLEDGDSIRPSCSIPLDDTSFLLCAYEHVEDAIENAYSAQSTIHAFDTFSLDEKWRTQPIAGQITSMHLIASHKTVIAIGKKDEREDAGDRDFATIVVALNTETGSVLRADKINHRRHGASVVYCALTQVQAESTPAVVAVFTNGDIGVTPLDAFLVEGFSRDVRSGSVAVSHPCGDPVNVISAAVGARSAVLVTSESNMRLVSW